MLGYKEIQVDQKRRLTLLLRLRNGEIDLNMAISDLIAEMEQEDVAWVEKQVSKNER
ncbi:MAG: hypothetical protein FWE33_05515 [Defluviitaleaceae bacterium]|nr:hypothetical protein [Defluviitaleaceae bacterium]